MPLDIFCGCTARFVLELVGNPEDRFSHNEAHTDLKLLSPTWSRCYKTFFMLNSAVCLLVSVDASCPSQQFFSHVQTEPPLPGYLGITSTFRGVNVSFISAKHEI